MSSTATRSQSNRAASTDTNSTDHDSASIGLEALVAARADAVDVNSKAQPVIPTQAEDAGDGQQSIEETPPNAEQLAVDLNRLVQSVAAIEELSQQARHA